MSARSQNGGAKSGVSRRLMLGGVFGAAAALAFAAEPRRPIPARIWFNHDGTNIMTVVSPWHARGQPFSEKLFRDSIDELAGKGIDVVALSPGNGAVPWWQSKTNDHWRWYVQRSGRQPGAIGQYIMAGGDLIRAFVEECRKNSLSPVISLRLKDEHDIDRLDGEGVPRFYVEHQGWRLDPRPRAVFGLRGLNWIHPEVPAERLALLAELAGNYDLDGVELDFMRFFPYFDLGHTTYRERCAVMTGFVRDVRALLDRTAKPGQRRLLAVRVPNRKSEYDALGLDLGLLDREGLVDVVNLSPSYVSQVDSDVALIAAWAPGAALFYEITHASSRGPSPSWGQFGDDYPIRCTTDEQFYTAANLAYARGAKGISLFNFPYTRASARSGTLAIGGSIGREPPFRIIAHLRDRSWLAAQPQHYWIPYWWKTGYHGRQFQLPRTFVVGTSKSFELDLKLPTSPASGARLRLRRAGSTPVLSATEPIPYARGRPTITWEARLNDVRLEPTPNVAEPFPEPYGGFLGAPEDYSAWEVPVAALRDGPNAITLELANGPVSEEFKVDVIWIDLAVFTGSPVKPTS